MTYTHLEMLSKIQRVSALIDRAADEAIPLSYREEAGYFLLRIAALSPNQDSDDQDFPLKKILYSANMTRRLEEKLLNLRSESVKDTFATLLGIILPVDLSHWGKLKELLSDGYLPVRFEIARLASVLPVNHPDRILAINVLFQPLASESGCLNNANLIQRCSDSIALFKNEKAYCLSKISIVAASENEKIANAAKLYLAALNTS